MDQWNPNSHLYCVECPYYTPVAQFIYEMELRPETRKCRNLKQCYRVEKMIAAARKDEETQMTMWGN